MRLPLLGSPPDDGGVVDDRARALLDHVPQRGACHAHRAGEGYVEHRKPLLVGHLRERGGSAEARVVHEHVELPAAEVDGFRDQTLHVLLDGDIAERGVRARAQLLGRLPQPAFVNVADDDARALLDRAFCRREPDPGSGRGRDQHRLPREQTAPGGIGRPLGSGRPRGRVRHLGSFGNPRACSPITLRWIWFEPP